MPKPPTRMTLDGKRLLGKANRLAELREERKKIEAEEAELKKQLLAVVEKDGEPVPGSTMSQIVLPNGDKLQLRRSDRETFKHQEAMDLLLTLDEAVATRYTQTSTSRDLIESAFHNGDITAEQLSSTIAVKVTKALHIVESK